MLKYKYLNWVGKSCLYQILKRFEIVDHYCDVSHNLSKGLVELPTIIVIIHTILAYAGEHWAVSIACPMAILAGPNEEPWPEMQYWK